MHHSCRFTSLGIVCLLAAAPWQAAYGQTDKLTPDEPIESIQAPGGDDDDPAGGLRGVNSCNTATAIGEGTYSGSNFCIGCTAFDVTSCGFNDTHGVWYKLTPACSRTVNLSTCGSALDTVLAVFADAACTPNTDIACNDDLDCGYGSRVSFAAVAGTTYFIRVAGYQSAIDSFQLNVDYGPPTNNACANMKAVGAGSTSFCNTEATTDGPNEPGCNFFGETQVLSDVWFSYRPPAPGLVIADVCSSNFDPKINVYGPFLDPFVLCPTSAGTLACNDDSCGVGPRVSFMTGSNNAYILRVGGYNGQQGTGQLAINFLPTPPHNTCGGAMQIESVPFSDYIGDTRVLSQDGPSPCGSESGPDVWYRFTPTESCHYRLSMCGSGHTTGLRVYTGSCAGLTIVNGLCQDLFSTCEFGPARTSFSMDLLAGTTYYIQALLYTGGNGAPLAFGITKEGSADDSVLYVNSYATGANDGSNWENAFSSVQAAVTEARISGGAFDEIWVAEGTYREESVYLSSGIGIYGGFSFIGDQCERDQRDWKAHPTILSGDINGDDGPGFTNRADNAYTVVVAFESGNTAVLDGFIVRGGGRASPTDFAPGALEIRNTSPTIRNCVFIDNQGNTNYGAVDIEGGSAPHFADCEFVANRSIILGSAVTINGASSTFHNCVFRRNIADISLGSGGTITAFNSAALTMENCTFVQNTSRNTGVFNTYPNSAECTLSLVNCTIAGNMSFLGRGAASWTGPVALRNTIVWGNTQGVEGQLAVRRWTGLSPALTIESSLIEGGYESVAAGKSADAVAWGAGNVEFDPKLTPEGRLRAGSPAIDAGTPDAPATDRDNEARIGAVDIGSDEFVDVDADGMADAWEREHFSTNSLPAEADIDSDTLSNREEYELYGTDPASASIFVNGATGNDAYSGYFAVYLGSFAGPKQHIQAGIDAAPDGGTVLVAGGAYSSALDRNLDFRSKSLVLKATEAATISGAALTRPLGIRELAPAFVTVEGFTLSGGAAPVAESQTQSGVPIGGGAVPLQNSNLALRGCTVTGNRADSAGGGVSCRSSNLVLSGLLDLGGNMSGVFDADEGYMEACNVDVQSDLFLSGGTLRTYGSGALAGAGAIYLAADATLLVRPDQVYFQPPFRLATDLYGPGNVVVDFLATLTVESPEGTPGGERNVVDLSGAPPGSGCLDPGGAAAWGTITVNGTLFVRNAVVQNTNVDVTLANLENNAEIRNNDVSLVESSAGYGGEFFVAGDTTAQCNIITSYGDRYLDMDPDPNAVPRPTITENRIYVIITQGVSGDRGELLELRGEDYDCTGSTCPSGAYEASLSSDGFTPDPSANWVLEELEILPGAKLNLTDRPGFEFHGPGVRETVYVKKVILHAGAVLNTALHRMYYAALVDENDAPLVRNPGDPSAPLANGSRVVDVPLLGFSLVNIAMDDDTEFAVRIRPRLRESADAIEAEGAVERLLDAGGPNGIMEMRTRQDGGTSPATSVAAKGAFARAGDEDILITFQYLFADDPNADAELMVSLSGDPEAGIGNVEVARIRPPQSGRAGSIGSGAFATFFGVFPRGDLNFTRGTYIELELRGVDARAWIDNFDPQVRCTGTCADLSGDHAVSTADYLYVLGEYGQTLEAAGCTQGAFGCSPKSCLDSALNGDRYIDFGDLLAWDLYLNNPSALNLCGTGEPEAPLRGGSGGTPVSFPGNTLVVAGKPTGAGLQEDYLYPLTTAGACNGAARRPASSAGPNGYRGNTRLLADADGGLHQLHTSQGLVRLSDAQIVVAPAIESFEGKEVYVGINPTGQGGGFEGVPLTDAAFDADDATTAYVVPVYVVDLGASEPGNIPYKAVAKLALSGTGTFTVQRLYGLNPADDNCANSSSPPGLECSAQGLREVEFIPGMVGGADKLLVTAGRADNDNDWLLIYDEATGAESRVTLSSLSPALDAPIAMTFAASTDKVYIASSLNNLDASTVQVHRLNLIRAAGSATGVALEASINVSTMRNVVAMAASPANGGVWVLGFTSPVFDQYRTFANTDSILSTPTLATIPSSAANGSTISASAVACQSLALPVSLAFSGAGAVTTGACCIDPPGAGNSTCGEAADPGSCQPFVCDVADHLPASFAGCYGDADGNGTVNPGDRGFVSANIGQSDSVLVCRFDMDGNGTINAGDRGFVSANINLCQPLPDWQNGSGMNHGAPDTRFGTATFQGAGTTCATVVCP